jgi:Co/Zn/Cd efflux system component
MVLSYPFDVHSFTINRAIRTAKRVSNVSDIRIVDFMVHRRKAVRQHIQQQRQHASANNSLRRRQISSYHLSKTQVQITFSHGRQKLVIQESRPKRKHVEAQVSLRKAR